MTVAAHTERAEAVELHPGRVYALGGMVALDGAISWVPEGTRGWEPMSCYLIRGERGSLLIDTGAGAHLAAILDQLRSVLPAGSPLSILLTRTELDCAVNVAAIEAHYAVDVLRYTGGITVPRRDGPGTGNVERFGIKPGEARMLEAAPSVELEILSPHLRLLPVLWPYDPVSRTLFVSDAFGHMRAGAPSDPLVVSGFETEVGEQEVRETLLAKFGWFAGADTAPIADGLRAVFAEREVELLAPTHGRVIAGRRAVLRHAELLERVIREVGR